VGPCCEQADVVVEGPAELGQRRVAELVRLLAVTRVGQVDDVEDLGAAEAGDLHST
jgi:hypothetical protein